MTKLLVANAGTWQPSPEQFSSAVEQLHREDSVRRAIESARVSATRQGSMHPSPENKARLLARHLLLCELTDCGNTQAKRQFCKRDVRLLTSAYGKPLTAPYRDGNYSVTHVAEWVCCAHSMAAPLGVDVAAVHPQDSAPFSLCLSKQELARVEAVQRKQRPSLFALFWTLKEAVLKALGLGLSTRLQMCDICLDSVKLENLSLLPNVEPASVYTAPKYRLMVSLQGNTKQAWACSCFMLPGDPPHILSVVLREEVMDGVIEVMFVSPQTALRK
ncbi:phosphopantetheinyl transferase-like protein [Leishmania infantum JPCM5]|uniref:holo-[acyl-carrier-protein] synthase n=2 Tax=Leishmania infantum TaxID=5671 RepID=A0A6L0XE52_LEIIN|nr:phosphopantetheinyl transferase-like protein [Leishmania infantum JPCM5]CAC9484409.1 phosphopantetheinyl_transferase-like_protein [Leishmania infantum]CAM67463.1 phosphopantetheinyl transferase-like protein [Leishmania infantum JPCM5]SUZ41359.1 phosphopantetheinyl_transferase-like_protein [Leishmania infantum]|eukprot:XP_001465216.1 phosphopantetheinyl transferase-like protein [Leishmania infantum JPCM5]